MFTLFAINFGQSRLNANALCSFLALFLFALSNEFNKEMCYHNTSPLRFNFAINIALRIDGISIPLNIATHRNNAKPMVEHFLCVPISHINRYSIQHIFCIDTNALRLHFARKLMIHFRFYMEILDHCRAFLSCLLATLLENLLTHKPNEEYR